MAKTIIATENAPAAVGAYSQATVCGDLLFVSGQLGLVPGTGRLVDGGVEAQAEQALKNLEAILAAAGLETAAVLKTTVLLVDIEDFAVVNAVYARHFAKDPPARAAFAVAALPLGAQVEIEAVASAGQPCSS
ncbi:MAG: Rid family detoxifying hydrolase [Pseudomonadota bacterium]